MIIIGSVINYALLLFLMVLFARMILSWVPVLVRDWQPRGPMLVAACPPHWEGVVMSRGPCQPPRAGR